MTETKLASLLNGTSLVFGPYETLQEISLDRNDDNIEVRFFVDSLKSSFECAIRPLQPTCISTPIFSSSNSRCYNNILQLDYIVAPESLELKYNEETKARSLGDIHNMQTPLTHCTLNSKSGSSLQV
jgi:hypothetical protein